MRRVITYLWMRVDIGDLGSATTVGSLVQSTTEWFSKTGLIDQPAKARYDWYMSAAALAAELHKPNWKEKLIQDGHCPARLLVAAVEEVQTYWTCCKLSCVVQKFHSTLYTSGTSSAHDFATDCSTAVKLAYWTAC